MNKKEIKEIVADGKKEIEFAVGSVTFILVRILPGEFLMGSSPIEPGSRTNEQPVQRVNINQAFYLGKYEVTQKQYEKVVGTNPSSHKGEELPVYGLTVSEALDFCRKLSEKTGLDVTLPPADGTGNLPPAGIDLPADRQTDRAATGRNGPATGRNPEHGDQA